MRTIKLTISYDGTNYRGWQLQKNGWTLQAEIEKAIKKVFKKHHRLYAAGRTDTGVHARGQVAHFKTAGTVPAGKIKTALNSFLPEDIAIIKSEEVPGDFHARFNAKKKHYRYYITTSRKRDPFGERYLWRIPYDLDVSLMRSEARKLLGTHDFRSFQASEKKERSSVRRITKIDIKKNGSQISIDIEADGFLYNMVRNIVGTLVDIGRGYSPPGSMQKILKSKDRREAGPTAPAKGLFLAEVKY
ncbi:MAG: tRNA pseudouridine(38-40) synthase TruA [Candidatus Omnitrophica bacterium]|nr:tRNA pseudouridine(38-40) synthase TruA [Candidatus Omnitrophota bacterium]